MRNEPGTRLKEFVFALTAAEAELISPARFIIRDIKKQVR